MSLSPTNALDDAWVAQNGRGSGATFLQRAQIDERDDAVKAASEGVAFELSDSALRCAWIARAPTREGVLTWLEALDAEGVSVAKAFGRRPDGASLRTQGPGCWRAVIAHYVRAPSSGSG